MPTASPLKPPSSPWPSADRHYLTRLFSPRSVAIVGGSEREGALGRLVMENMIRAGFAGSLCAVNPKYTTVLSHPSYATLADLPDVPDLVIVTSPALSVPTVLRDAGARGISSVVVLSAGFAETGAAGVALAERALTEAQAHGIRMIGPNCLGIMRPSIGLNATFANTDAKPGALALISQSGAVCTAILDWAASGGIGFSSVVSLGGALDLDFGEVLDYLIHDTATRGILLYVEGVHDARRFISSLRAASRIKPVIVMKVGRNSSGSHAVSSHTGALAGSDKVWDAALARAGAVRVDSSMQLFAAARLLANPRIARAMRGNRLAIVTNGGGPGVVAADSAERDGLKLATLGDETLKLLDAALPAHWSHANPVDIIGDATPQRFAAAVEAVVADPNVDAVLTMFCPQAITRAEAAAAAVIPIATKALKEGSKPVFTSWLGGVSIAAARKQFDEAGVPNFLTPETAVDAFSYLARFSAHQALLKESVSAAESMTFHELTDAITEACVIRDAALASGRTVLLENEAKALLRAFQLPVATGRVAKTAEEAVSIATEIGFPVVLKIESPGITHKSDVGGVRLNIANARQTIAAFESIIADVKDSRPNAIVNGINVQPMLKFSHARELLIGISRDPTFGPVIAFGSGGVSVEAMADTALAIPPLNDALADNLITATAISRVLGEYRNIPAIDRDALKRAIVRTATIASVLPWIREMDMNPVLAHPDGVSVLDARIAIDGTSPSTDTRYRHMAIFPYPVELERELQLRDGTVVRMRAIRPDDATRERAFVASMSDTSRYFRFMHSVSTLSDDMIARFTQLDYDREMALIALTSDESVIAGVARYSPNADGRTIEFAVAIADAWQGRGLGVLLMQNLIACAEDAGYAGIEGTVLHANQAMIALAHRVGFEVISEAGNRDAMKLRYIFRQT